MPGDVAGGRIDFMLGFQDGASASLRNASSNYDRMSRSMDRAVDSASRMQTTDQKLSSGMQKSMQNLQKESKSTMKATEELNKATRDLQKQQKDQTKAVEELSQATGKSKRGRKGGDSPGLAWSTDELKDSYEEVQPFLNKLTQGILVYNVATGKASITSMGFKKAVEAYHKEIVKGINILYEYSKEFDDLMVKYRTNVNASTSAQYELSKSLHLAQVEYGLLDNELQNIVSQMQEFKIAQNDMKSFVNITGKMIKSLGMAEQAAVELTYTLGGQVGIGYDRVESVMSALAVTAESSAVSVDQLTEALKNPENVKAFQRVALYGGDAEKAMVNMTTAVGRFSDAWANAGEFQQIAQNMMDPRKIGDTAKIAGFLSKHLKGVKLETSGAVFSMSSLREEVKKGNFDQLGEAIFRAAKNLDPEQLKMFGENIIDIYGISQETLINLQKSGDPKSFAEAVKASDEAAKKQKALQDRYERATNSIQEMSRQIKDVFKPILVDLGAIIVSIVKTALTPLLWVLKGISKFLVMIPGPIKTLVTLFLMLAAAATTYYLAKAKLSMYMTAYTVIKKALIASENRYAVAIVRTLTLTKAQIIAMYASAKAAIFNRVSNNGLTLSQRLWAASSKLATFAQMKLNAAMSANPVGAIIVAVTLLAMALYKLWHTIDSGNKKIRALSTVLMYVLGPLGQLVLAIKVLYKLFTEGPEKTMEWLGSIATGLKDLGLWLTKLPYKIITTLADFISMLVDEVVTYVEDLIATIPDKVNKMVEQFPSILEQMFSGEEGAEKDASGKFLSAVWRLLKTVFWKLPKLFLKLIPQLVYTLIKQIPKILGAVAAETATAIANFIDDVVIGQGLNQIYKWLDTLPDKITAFFESIPQMISDYLEQGFQDAEASNGIFAKLGKAFFRIFVAFAVKLPFALTKILIKLPFILSKIMMKLPWIIIKALGSSIGVMLQYLIDVITGEQQVSGIFGAILKFFAVALAPLLITYKVIQVVYNFFSDIYEWLTSPDRPQWLQTVLWLVKATVYPFGALYDAAVWLYDAFNSSDRPTWLTYVMYAIAGPLLPFLAIYEAAKWLYDAWNSTKSPKWLSSIWSIFKYMVFPITFVWDAIKWIYEAFTNPKESWIIQSILHPLEAVQGVIEAISNVITDMIGWISGKIDWFLEKIGAISDVFSDPASAVSSGANGAAGLAKDIASYVPGTGAVISAAESVSDLAGEIWPFQRGGVATKKMLGMVAEGGPEAVIPLSKLPSLIRGSEKNPIFVKIVNFDDQYSADAMSKANTAGVGPKQQKELVQASKKSLPWSFGMDEGFGFGAFGPMVTPPGAPGAAGAGGMPVGGMPVVPQSVPSLPGVTVGTAPSRSYAPPTGVTAGEYRPGEVQGTEGVTNPAYLPSAPTYGKFTTGIIPSASQDKMLSIQKGEIEFSDKRVKEVTLRTPPEFVKKYGRSYKNLTGTGKLGGTQMGRLRGKKESGILKKRFHQGEDIYIPPGAPVYAPFSGVTAGYYNLSMKVPAKDAKGNLIPGKKDLSDAGYALVIASSENPNLMTRLLHIKDVPSKLQKKGTPVMEGDQIGRNFHDGTNPKWVLEKNEKYRHRFYGNDPAHIHLEAVWGKGSGQWKNKRGGKIYFQKGKGNINPFAAFDASKIFQPSAGSTASPSASSQIDYSAAQYGNIPPIEGTIVAPSVSDKVAEATSSPSIMSRVGSVASGVGGAISGAISTARGIISGIGGAVSYGQASTGNLSGVSAPPPSAGKLESMEPMPTLALGTLEKGSGLEVVGIEARLDTIAQLLAADDAAIVSLLKAIPPEQRHRLVMTAFGQGLLNPEEI